jgi:PKD repeat protein
MEFLWTFTNAGTYTVTLTVTDNKGAIGTDSVVVEVLNPVMTVGVEVMDGVAAEPVGAAGNGKFRVVRVGGDVSQAVTVNVAVAGTAINGADYTAIGTQVVLRAGTTYTDVNVYPKVDGEIEPDEYVTLTVLPGAGYAVDPEKSAGACIVKDSTDLSTPVVSLGVLDGIATEPNGTATDNGKVTFKRTSRLHEVLKVNVAIAGTASNGVDYSKITVPVSFLAGQNVANVAVNPLADTVVEGDETVVFTLQAGTGYTVNASSNTATVAIRNANR